MSEYIIELPDEDYDKRSGRYYPGERHDPKPVYEEIVRCRDCTNFAHDQLGDYCTLLDFEDVKPMGDMFCAWGEREAGE